ncbi:rod shape-determining protein MreC [Patescibacteria group bacterium]|nr:rod shape-determining protein MreC [Patescibacteria group bacterium]
MKKIFRHPLILSFLVVSGFVFLNFYGWLAGVENIFFKISFPFQSVFYQSSLKLNNLADFVFSIRNLEKENSGLEDKNLEFLSEMTRLKEVERENEFLRKQLGLGFPEGKSLMLAGVIGRESSGLGQFALIDKGARDGIAKDDPVVAAGNFLVGQVIEAGDFFSKVKLIIDPASKINAIIQEQSITGLTEVENGTSLVIGFLPQQEAVEKGKLIVTSGLAGIFPAGLLIGRVGEVISSDAQISQRAKIETLINFDTLDKVFVIKKNSD